MTHDRPRQPINDNCTSTKSTNTLHHADHHKPKSIYYHQPRRIRNTSRPSPRRLLHLSPLSRKKKKKKKKENGEKHQRNIVSEVVATSLPRGELGPSSSGPPVPGPSSGQINSGRQGRTCHVGDCLSRVVIISRQNLCHVARATDASSINRRHHHPSSKQPPHHPLATLGSAHSHHSHHSHTLTLTSTNDDMVNHYHVVVISILSLSIKLLPNSLDFIPILHYRGRSSPS